MTRTGLLTLALVVAVVACSSSQTTASTYVDMDGRLWLATDCPEADVILLTGSDGLPPKSEAEKEQVEQLASTSDQYSVVPRNGWVWERLPDDTGVVSQVEDYMLQRTLETDDDCPNVPAWLGSTPIAYVVQSD